MTTQAITLSKERQDHLKVARTSFRLLEALGTELTAKVAVNRFLTPRKRPLSAKAQADLEKAYPVTVPHGTWELAAYVCGAYGPTVLLVHGILHLFGYDHEASENQARIMDSKGDEVMILLGF